VLWAIVRHETTDVYSVLLGDLKSACEAQMPADAEWKPSCCLVDNSDAEINAARCVHTQFCASSRSQACIILRSKLFVHTMVATLSWMDQSSTLPISNIGIPALFARFSAGKARHFRHFFR
jgi:hypothetical protein